MNRIEYLEQAKSLLSDNFRPNDPDGSMTAASAAYLLKRLIGNFEDVGFFKFRDLLDHLQSEGFLEIGSNSKNAFSFRLLGEEREEISRPIPMQKRLKADVWYAFVKADPSGKRFFNSASGEIRTRRDVSPGDGWIELTPISSEWEKQNAIEFLERRNVTSETARQAILDPKWYLAFTESLFDVAPQLANDWKRERSHAVIEVVEKWRNANSIDMSLVYESATPDKKRVVSPVKPVPATRNQDHLRAVLLNSISRMTTAELLEIRISASILIGELRPDLLQ